MAKSEPKASEGLTPKEGVTAADTALLVQLMTTDPKLPQQEE